MRKKEPVNEKLTDLRANMCRYGVVLADLYFVCESAIMWGGSNTKCTDVCT